MTWQAWLLTLLIVAFAIVQYTLAWSALSDLLQRPRVRGNSHTAWALVVLCVPIFGALVYGSVGPTSFRGASDRSDRLNTAKDARTQREIFSHPPANVTPFRKPSGSLSDRLPEVRPGLTRSRAHNAGAVRIRRPGA